MGLILDGGMHSRHSGWVFNDSGQRTGQGWVVGAGLALCTRWMKNQATPDWLSPVRDID